MCRLFILIIIILTFSACTSNKKYCSQNNAVIVLRENLLNVGKQGIIFGHQDDLAYGVGWKGITNDSDVKRIAGDYPALFGWELGNIGDSVNLDGVSFDSIIVYIKRVHQMGGINTISWHARNPITELDAWNHTNVDVKSLLPGGKNHFLLKAKLDLIASFVYNLRTEKGELIPIIFRPWHEMYGEWFWWGTKTCSEKEYSELFRYTIEYLREEKNINNLLIAFSPDAGATTRDKYLLRYPGDKYVDILGLDNYGDFKINRLDNIVQKISIVVDLAVEKNKIAAFTETGSDKLEIENWYTTNLLQVLKANSKTRSIAYVMVWRNNDENHFYVPYQTHPQADDFRCFVNDELIYLLSDYNKKKK